MSYKTILPYVGGKQKVVKLLARYFPRNLSALGSPFIGGGSVEVYWASQGVRVYGADACSELATFWQVLLSKPEAVAERFKSKMPVTYPLTPYWDALLAGSHDPVEVAALFYIVIAGKYGSVPQAGNKGSPQAIGKMRRNAGTRASAMRNFRLPNLSVQCLDCFDFLIKYPDLPLYCDPPYATGTQGMYGIKSNLHSKFPHKAWRDALMRHEAPWVQSYDDSDLIRRLYDGCVIQEETWMYTSKTDRSFGRELVIRPPGSPPVAELDRQAVTERQRSVGAYRLARERQEVSLAARML